MLEACCHQVLSRRQSVKTTLPFTPGRIVFWTIVASLSALAIHLGVDKFSGKSHVSPVLECSLNQHNLQQAARAYQLLNHLNPGDPLPWNKIIGPGLLLEKAPVCPVHGSAYLYSASVPAAGTMVAPCSDPAHRPTDTRDW